MSQRNRGGVRAEVDRRVREDNADTGKREHALWQRDPPRLPGDGGEAWRENSGIQWSTRGAPRASTRLPRPHLRRSARRGSRSSTRRPAGDVDRRCRLVLSVRVRHRNPPFRAATDGEGFGFPHSASSAPRGFPHRIRVRVSWCSRIDSPADRLPPRRRTQPEAPPPPTSKPSGSLRSRRTSPA